MVTESILQEQYFPETTGLQWNSWQDSIRETAVTVDPGHWLSSLLQSSSVLGVIGWASVVQIQLIGWTTAKIRGAP